MGIVLNKENTIMSCHAKCYVVYGFPTYVILKSKLKKSNFLSRYYLLPYCSLFYVDFMVLTINQ